MRRISRDEVKDLTDKEVKIACERIKRDYSFGLLDDRVTPLENTMLLEEELRRRGYALGN
ncbi:MAG: hypothetical protein ACYC99_17305 [Candidatus Geothermincolia bacterium]